MDSCLSSEDKRLEISLAISEMKKKVTFFPLYFIFINVVDY